MEKKEEKTWGALVHLGGLIGMFILSYVGNIVGALVMWLIKRNESSFIDNQGKEALNFQITISFINVAIGLLISIRHGVWAFRGMWRHNWDFNFFSFASLYGIVWLLNVIFSIIAAVKASNGIAYRYPISWRIVK